MAAPRRRGVPAPATGSVEVAGRAGATDVPTPRGDVAVTVACGGAVRAAPPVLPQVTGTAYRTGEHVFAVDPHDPLVPGSVLR